MSRYVVDACVAMKWYLPEEHSASALRIVTPLHDLHVPDFFFVETDNILCKHIRRGFLTPTQGDQFRQSLRQVPLKVHEVREFQDEAFDTAVRFGRSLYDCLYVALAVLLEAQMVTADRRLFDSLARGPVAKYITWIGDIR